MIIFLMTLWYIWNTTGYLYLVNGMSGKMWLSRRNSFSNQDEQNGNSDELKDTNKTDEYQKIYSEWCHEFHKYQTALKTWEENKDKCGGPPPPAPNNNEYNSVYNTNPLI